MSAERIDALEKTVAELERANATAGLKRIG